MRNLGAWNWLKNLFKSGELQSLKDCHFELSAEYYYKKLAISTCVNLIANTLSTCEIKTFDKGKSIRGNNYYALNVEPNPNQNATAFLHKAIQKLIFERECLIIMHNDSFYVTDGYTVKESALFENIYSNVQVGDFTFTEKTFVESNVIRLKLTDEKILKVISDLYNSHGKMIEAAKSYYKLKNNKRLLVEGDYLRAQDDETQAQIDDMFENQLKNWFDPDKKAVAFQLQEGYKVTDMSDSRAGLTIDSRDINSLIDDVFNYVAMAFHVPRGLMKGDLTDIEKQVDNFIMFCINPIAEMIEDEFNRKIYKKKNFLERTYLKIDTSKIKISDIKDLAITFDKLFAIGFTLNEIFEEMGREKVDDPLANVRHITKNYQTVEQSLQGGE